MSCWVHPGSWSWASFANTLAFLLLLHTAACAIIPKSNVTRLTQNGRTCTQSADWLGQAMATEEDCSAAVNKFYHMETLKHGRYNFEFVGKGASAESVLPVVRTPRRYTVGKLSPTSNEQHVSADSGQGKCTLVLAMLNVFPDGALPNAPKGPTYPTDIASFDEVWHLAIDLVLQCLVLQHSAGYRVAGMDISKVLNFQEIIEH